MQVEAEARELLQSLVEEESESDTDSTLDVEPIRYKPLHLEQ